MGTVSEATEDINRRLLRARDAMDRHYAEPLDVAHLAQIAYMARSHFIREFSRVFGETPHRYLQRRRVERAMFLLRHTNTTATEICMAVGFASFGTFSRTFTAIVGQPPNTYRVTPASQHRPAPTLFAMRWTRPAAFGRRPAAKPAGQRDCTETKDAKAS
jgi:AraC-like DNA-binding protein